MTMLTANGAVKNTGVADRIGNVLRNIFVGFAQIEKSQATIQAADLHIVDGMAQMKHLANKFESTQPNLAAELRFIASRG